MALDVISFLKNIRNIPIKSPEQLCSPVQEEDSTATSQYEWILGSHYCRYDKLTDKVQNIILALKNMNSKVAKEATGEDGDDK